MATASELHCALVGSLQPPGDPRLDAPHRSALQRFAMAPIGQAAPLLARHGVAALWQRAWQQAGFGESPATVGWREWLQAQQQASIARTLAQQAMAARLTAALERADIQHLLFKGLQLAQTLYEAPWLRPALDIDLLVDRDARGAAADVLHKLGFGALANPPNPSHELHFSNGDLGIDLHWHPLRPGRSRLPLTPWMLQRRRNHQGLWVPDDEATTVILLLHTAYTEQVNGRLLRLIDIDRWLRRHPQSIAAALPMLQACGGKTAAWTVLQHVQALWQTPLDAAALAALAPPAWQRAYLRRWLACDPASLYARHPLRVRLGFSLFLQDKPADAWLALRSWLQAQRQAQDDVVRCILARSVGEQVA